MAVSLIGCLQPQSLEPTELNRYQQQMVQQGPKSARVDDGKASMLLPAKSDLLPDPKVIPDPQTGRSRIPLSLNDAIMRTLANSPEIRVVSYDPAIARETVAQAAAEFDVTAFAGFTYERGETEVDSLYQEELASRRATMQAGLRQKLITGAQHSLTWQQSRLWDNAQGAPVTVNRIVMVGTTPTTVPVSVPTSAHRFLPVWESTFVYQITQPLLRDAGPEFNLARFHIAQVNEKISRQQFRQKVEDTITEVTSLYWTLIQTREELVIAQNLLDTTEATYQRLLGRKDLDVTKVQLKQTEAAVEQRKAILIRARKNIYDAQDKLARQMGDRNINLLDVYDIEPLTAPASHEVQIDVNDQLLTALRNNPVLDQARLAIEAAGLEVVIAKNQALPRLDVVFSYAQQALRETSGAAFDKALGGADHTTAIGAQFEYPLGNRGPTADLAGRVFSKQRAIAQMQNLVDQVSQVVKEDIRQVYATYQEIRANHAVVEANKAQLEALEDTEQIRGRLTPEFLQIKLQAQEALAAAQRNELAALVSYNTALAELARATGMTLKTHRVNMAMPVVLQDKPFPKESLTPQTSPVIEEATQTQPVQGDSNGTTQPATSTRPE